jgi:hypothetical protein
VEKIEAVKAKVVEEAATAAPGAKTKEVKDVVAETTPALQGPAEDPTEVK